MAIGIAYIGERRFHNTSMRNHEELFDLLRTKYEIKIYDFTKGERINAGALADRFRSNSSDAACPYDTSGAIQLWDFVQANKQVAEDIIIKIRTDIWFTKNSMQVVLKELDEIVDGNTDVSFMGLDFLNCCDKLYERSEAVEKKVPDFVIIARRSALASAETIIEKVEAPSKQKSGNVMFKYILGEGARAVKVSCQMYLIRHEYAEPNNWQIYSEWTSQYHKSVESQKWVAENRKFIGKL
jgi:hypothetical protein